MMTAQMSGLSLWYAPWRVSRLGLALVAITHVALLWAVMQMRTSVVLPLPRPLTPAPVLSVSLLPLAPAPQVEKSTLPVPSSTMPRVVRTMPLLAAPNNIRMPSPHPPPQVESQPEPVLAAAATVTPTSVARLAQTQALSPVPTPPPTPPRFDAAYLENPRPAYPLISRRMGEQGKVLLRVSVDAAGRPVDVQLNTGSGSPRLDDAALEAVRRWRFAPARLGDLPVAASVIVPIVFSLKE